MGQAPRLGRDIGTAAQQALVAMPAMVWQLETAILNAIQMGNPLWLGLFGLKFCLSDTVGIMKANAEASWQEVNPVELRRQFLLDLRKAAEVIGERDKFIFKQVTGLAMLKRNKCAFVRVSPVGSL